jgi:hypothetical protein
MKICIKASTKKHGGLERHQERHMIDRVQLTGAACRDESDL